MKPVTRITADMHGFHDGIINHCPDTRPFRNAAEMNEAFIAAWIAAGIQKDDTTIIVGDFVYRSADEKATRRFFDALPGKKILCKGNHDGPSTLSLPWESVHDILTASIDSQRVVFCHYAMRTWDGIRKGALMLYGHNHGRLPGSSQSCDVGVDVFGMAPVRLNVIKQYLATLPPLIDPEGRDFSNDSSEGMKP